MLSSFVAEKNPAEKDKREEMQLSLSHHPEITVFRVWGDLPFLTRSHTHTHTHIYTPWGQTVRLPAFGGHEHRRLYFCPNLSFSFFFFFPFVLCPRDASLGHTARIFLRHS